MDNVGYWTAPAMNVAPPSSVIDDIISRIEAITKIPITEKGRYRSLCEGRQLAAYIMHVKYGMSLYSVGERLNIDHSTVAHSAKCVETFLTSDKKFVTRWHDIIDYAELEKDTEIVEPEIIQDESELPSRCEECTAYLIKERLCELRFIRCYDSKPLAKECRTFHLKKRKL